MLDLSTRRRSEELLNESKWCIVYRGYACGVHAKYDLEGFGVCQVSDFLSIKRKHRGFPDEASAGVADQLQLALLTQQH